MPLKTTEIAFLFFSEEFPMEQLREININRTPIDFECTNLSFISILHWQLFEPAH